MFHIPVACLNLVTEGRRVLGTTALDTGGVQAGRAITDAIAALVAGLGPLPLRGVPVSLGLPGAFAPLRSLSVTLQGAPAPQLLLHLLLVYGHQTLLLGVPFGPAGKAPLLASRGRAADTGLVSRAVLPLLAVTEDAVDVQCFPRGSPAPAPAPAAATVAASFAPGVVAAVRVVPGAAVAPRPAGRLLSRRSENLGATGTLHLGRGSALLGRRLVSARPLPLAVGRRWIAMLSEAVRGRR